MTLNKVHNYIKKILQKSNLNKENSIKNRIKYSVTHVKHMSINRNNFINVQMRRLKFKEHDYSKF